MVARVGVANLSSQLWINVHKNSLNLSAIFLESVQIALSIFNSLTLSALLTPLFIIDLISPQVLLMSPLTFLKWLEYYFFSAFLIVLVNLFYMLCILRACSHFSNLANFCTKSFPVVLV